MDGHPPEQPCRLPNRISTPSIEGVVHVSAMHHWWYRSTVVSTYFQTDLVCLTAVSSTDATAMWSTLFRTASA